MPTDQEMRVDREARVRALVESRARLKVIVAGPGTGKTHAIRHVLDAASGDRLVLSFINNLIEDLRRELGDVAEVHTLHSFGRGLLHRHGPAGITSDVALYPALLEIQAADATLLRKTRVTKDDIDGVLHKMEKGEILDVAIRSGDYYNAVGFTDSVYRIVRHLQEHPRDVPHVAQLVVDEFQDFSAVEVELIRILYEESPVLVVGDDDQALYSFKTATAEHIRGLATSPEFERFELPYCSRCTSVLVDGGQGLAISSSSEPAIMAVMLEQLGIDDGHRVLEIGTGSGYNARPVPTSLRAAVGEIDSLADPAWMFLSLTQAPTSLRAEEGETD